MNVYALFGHGCDLITPAIKEGGDMLIVPEGCIYVTLTFCGFISFDLLKLFIAFRDPFIADALKDPITHLDALNKYFETASGSQNDIHIHKAGDHYVDSINNFIYDTKTGGKIRLYKSGIYTLGNIPETRNPGIFESTFIQDTIKFTRDMIEDAYNGSLIKPTGLREEYANIEEFSSAHKAQLEVRFSALMAKSPGIYYNFACRNVCNPEYQGLARERRQLSARGKAPPGTAESATTQLGKHVLEDLNRWISEKPYHTYYFDLKLKELRQKNAKKHRINKRMLMVAENKRNRNATPRAKKKGPKASKRHSTRRKTPRRTPGAIPMVINNNP